MKIWLQTSHRYPRAGKNTDFKDTVGIFSQSVGISAGTLNDVFALFGLDDSIVFVSVSVSASLVNVSPF